MVNSKVYYIFLFIMVIFLLFSENIGALTHVEPARVIVKIEPGQRNTGVIRVSNKGEEEINVKALLYDWELALDDSIIVLEPGSTSFTMEGLIKFNPRNFKIQPGKTQIVRYTITAPKDLKQELRGIVFFEEETGLIDESTGANILTQVGTAIYFVPTTARSKFLLKGGRVEKGNDGQMRVLLWIENDGTTHVRYTINYKLINKQGALLEENKLKELVILPDNTRVVSFPIHKKLERGNYNILLTLEFFGTDNIANYSIPFKVDSN